MRMADICDYGEVQNMTIRTATGIVISKMSGKLQGFYSINTNPFDNPYCNKMASIPGSICEQCYSRKMLTTMRKSCNRSWSENAFRISKEVIPEKLLPDLSGLQCNGAFRFSSHGEIINENHLINLCNIARKNPDITFGLWTKRVDMIQKHRDQIPSNVVLIASTRWVDIAQPSVPDGFDKVFSAYTKPFAEQHTVPINCSGHCKECMTCYRKNNGVTHINELIK